MDFGPLDLLPDSKQRLAVLDRLSVFYVYLGNLATRFSLNLVHQLHRFDDAHDGFRFHATTDAHESLSRRRGSAIEGSDYGRIDDEEIMIFRRRGSSLRAGMLCAPMRDALLRSGTCWRRVSSRRMGRARVGGCTF